MITFDESFGDEVNTLKRLLKEFGAELRVSSPGIIESFNPQKQTVSVRIALREKVNKNGDVTWMEIPILQEVPIFMPRAGGYLVTFPIRKGDECLVVFGDCCMDAWWQSGGVQNQIERRRHDLSDAYAIIGIWSQPRVVYGYSTNSTQLRNESGSAYVEIQGDNINLVGNKLSMKFNDIQSDSSTFVRNNSQDTTNTNAFVMNSSGVSKMNGSGNTEIDGRNFLSHKHSGVESGPSNTGGVV